MGRKRLLIVMFVVGALLASGSVTGVAPRAAAAAAPAAVLPSADRLAVGELAPAEAHGADLAVTSALATGASVTDPGPAAPAPALVDGTVAHVATPPTPPALPPAAPKAGGIEPGAVEDVAARTANSKTFVAASGRRVLQLSDGPLHFKGTSGTWDDIDNRVVRDGADATVLRSSANSWTARFRPFPDGVEFDPGDKGGTVRMAPVGAAAVVPVVEADGTSVLYAEAFPGVDIRYRVLRDQLKEEIVVKRADAVSDFAFDVDGTELTASSKGDGSMRGRRKGEGNDSVALLPTVVVDGKGNDVTTESKAKLARVARPAGGRNDPKGRDRVAVGADRTWLAGLDASSFPVVIDPSTTPLDLTPQTNGAKYAFGRVYRRSTNTWDGSAETVCPATGNQCINVRAGATVLDATFTKVWRSVVNFGQLYQAGFTPVAGVLRLTYDSAANDGGGSVTNAAAIAVREATTYGFCGVAVDNTSNPCTNYMPILGGIQSLGTTSVDADVSSAVVKPVNWAAGAVPAFAISGDESMSGGTFKKMQADLFLYIDRKPEVSTWDPFSNPFINSNVPLLSTVGTDPDGDVMRYRFNVCPVGVNPGGAGCFSSTTATDANQWPTTSFWSIPVANRLTWFSQYYWWADVCDGLLFAQTDVPVMIPNPGYGTSDARQGAASNAANSGSVDTASGNFHFSELDASVSTVGPPLQIRRSYNSLSTGVSAFGRGWSFSYDMNLTQTFDRAQTTLVTGAKVRMPDGRFEYFGLNPDNSYSRAYGYGDTLAFRTGGWTLTDADGTRYDFDTAGTLVALRDAAGHQVNITLSAGLVQSVTDVTSGRALTFTWTTPAGATRAHVATVSTAVVAAHGRSLTWRYTYSGDLLVAAADPRADLLSGLRTQYLYDTSNRLSGTRKPGQPGNQPVVGVEIGYVSSTDNRVAWQRNVLLNTWTYTYTANVALATPTGNATVNRTVTTDPRGFTTVEDYDAKVPRMVHRVNALGGVRWLEYDNNNFLSAVTDERSPTVKYTTRMTSDAFGNVLTRTDPAGYVWQATWQELKDAATTYRFFRIASETSPVAGTTVGYVYDTAGNRTRANYPATPDQPSGSAAIWTYTVGNEAAVGGGFMPAGLLRTTSDQRSKVTTYAYDTKGDLRSVTDPVGLATTYTYDEIGRQLQKTVTYNGASATTTTTYNELSLTTSVTEPPVLNAVTGVTHQKRTTYSYDGDSNLTTQRETDLTGGDAARQTSHRYDLADRQTDTTDPAGGVTSRSFDATGNVVSVFDAEGRSRTTTYNGLGQPTSTVLRSMVDDPVAGTAPYDLTEVSWTYDAQGNRTSETDAAGRQHVFAVDGLGRVTSDTLVGYHLRSGATANFVTSSVAFDPAGRVSHSESGDGLVKTDFGYDQMNRVTSRTLRNTVAAIPGASVDQTSTFHYDAAGNTVSETRTGGSVTEQTSYAYDDANRVLSTTVTNGTTSHVTKLQRDQRGIVVKSTDPRGNTTATPAPANTTTFDVDPLGRVFRVTSPTATIEAVAGTAVSATPVTLTGFDTFGEATHTTDARGATTAYTFDALGRRTGATYPPYVAADGSGTITATEQWAYDRVGNQTGHTDRRGGLTTYTFDKLNRVVRQQDPFIGAARPTTSFAYDRVGNETKRTDPVGAVTEATYDDLNRPRTTTQVVRGTTVNRYTTTYDYDGNGKTVFVSTPLGETTTSVYSPAGELLRTTDPLGKVTNSTYDLASRPLTTTDPLGRRTRNTYDAAGRTTATARVSNTGTTLFTTTFGYDLAGNQTSVTSPNGFTSTFAYDNLNRLSSVAQPVDATTTITTGYGYDANGNRTRTTDGRGNRWDATYNAWNLPDTITEPATTAQPALADRQYTTVYDAGGLPVLERQPGATISRTFDSAGRPTTQTADTTSTGTTVLNAFNFDAGVDTWFGGYGIAGLGTSGVGASSGSALTLSESGTNFGIGDDWPGRPVVGGQPYSFAASVRAGQATGDLLFLTVYWFDTTGAVIASARANPTGNADTSTRWTTLQGTLTAPASAVSAAMRVENNNDGAVGRIHYVDDVTMTGPTPALARSAVGSWGAVAYNSATPFTTGSLTPPRNSLLVVTVAAESNSAATVAPNLTLTSSIGTTFTAVASTTQQLGTNLRALRVFTAPIGTRLTAMTLTASGGTNVQLGWQVNAVAYTGYDTATPVGATATLSGGSLQFGGNVGPSSELFAALATDEATPTPPPVSPAAGFTELTETTTAQPHLQTQVRTGASTATSLPTWSSTGSGANPIGVGLEIRRAGSTKASTWLVYDNAGRVTRTLGSAGQEDFAYDDRDLLTTASGVAGSSSFAYDADGRVRTRTDAAGTSTYTYTARSELKTVADPLRGQTVTYTWNDAGQPTTISYGAATPGVRTFAYDTAGRLSGDTLRSGAGTTTWSATYGYDNDGNLTSKVIGPAGVAGAGTNAYSYDRSDRLKTWTNPANVTTTYTWDAAGNRTGNGAAAATYDQRNCLLTDGATTYTWTPNGNLQSTSVGGVVTASTFDAFGRMVRQGAVSYAYDDLGRMVRRNGAAVSYSGASDQPTADGTSLISRSPGGNPVAIRTAGITKFVGRDRHGDLAQLLGSDGVVSDTVAFDPFGVKTGATGATVPSNVGYQGDWTDPTTSLVNAGARWYKPASGGFVSRDSYAGTLDNPISLNRYTYASNNPLRYFDPDGHFSADTCERLLETDPDACGPGNADGTNGAGGMAVDPPASSSGSGGTSSGSGPHGAVVPDRFDPEPPPPAPTTAVVPDRLDKAPPDQVTTNEPLDFEHGIGTVKDFLAGLGASAKDFILNIKEMGKFALDVLGSGLSCAFSLFGGSCDGLKNKVKGVWKGLEKQGKEIWSAIQDAIEHGDPTAILNVVGKLTTGVDIAQCLAGSAAAYCVGKIVGSVAVQAIAGAGAGKLAEKLGELKAGLTAAIDDLPSGLATAAESCNSFPAGTPVVLADGTTRAIDDVRLGDTVAATDAATGETSSRPVTALIRHRTESGVTTLVVDEAGKREQVTATDHHPFWVDSEGRWIDAVELRAGDRLLALDGGRATVVAVHHGSADTTVYNLTVDGVHTYYVGTTVPVLVHNSKCVPAGISMDEAVARGAEHVGGTGKVIESGSGGYQFTNTERLPNGDIVTRNARFDINPNSAHVQKFGPHLNLETQVNGKTIMKGPFADPHLPIDPSSIRPGDIP